MTDHTGWVTGALLLAAPTAWPPEHREEAQDGDDPRWRVMRGPVGTVAAVAATPEADGWQAGARPSAHPQRDLVEAAHGGTLARPAPGAVWAVVDGGLPLPALASGGGGGPDLRRCAAGGRYGWPRGLVGAVCRWHRDPGPPARGGGPKRGAQSEALGRS